MKSPLRATPYTHLCVHWVFFEDFLSHTVSHNNPATITPRHPEDCQCEATFVGKQVTAIFHLKTGICQCSFSDLTGTIFFAQDQKMDW
jgi:hypothetical protein